MLQDEKEKERKNREAMAAVSHVVHHPLTLKQRSLASTDVR
jgi:signal transduction histidine kinase